MATTNTTTVKNTPEDKQKKNEKRAKRNSFKRIKKEGEIFVKSLFGKEKTDKSNNKKQDFVPPSPRTKYGKTRGNDDQQRVNTYPVSDDDNLKSKTKARNRLSINLADLIKSDDDKKEMEKRRRTFHFTDSHKDIDFAVDNINDNSSSDPKNVPTIKTNLNPILSTTQYDSPIVETLHISSAFSPITNMSNKDEKTIIQNDNLITPPIITAIINNILPEISPVNSFQNISSNKIVKTSSSINNNVDDSQTLNIIYSTHNNEDNEIVKNDRKQNDEKLMIVMTGEASNNNKMASNTKKIDIKNENKIEENSRINTLEAIVLRQLDLAEKMQETMTRLESKVNEQKEDSLVSSQMEDTIRKLENKINEQDVELDGLKMIVGKLCARESTNDDSQRSLQQSRFTDDSSRISTFFSDFFNFNFFSDNTESSPTTTSSLYKEHPCRYIGG
ncbi:2615_t:CDS:2 [Entrophospora sp. SA101]|nr:3885_t:CDS:2 [Entrophospora sp. SA101]CAJ0872033.1 2615_t:CDS:2 [Entrophospora sp. SA101]